MKVLNSSISITKKMVNILMLINQDIEKLKRIEEK